MTHSSTMWACPQCGSDKEIQALCWVDVNTGKVVTSADDQDYYCPHCNEHLKRLLDLTDPEELALADSLWVKGAEKL